MIAASYAALGYWKTTAKDPQKFDRVKFLSTFILGLIFGGIGAYLGWAPAVVEEWLAGLMVLGGLVIFVEWIAKGILRRIRPTMDLANDGGTRKKIPLGVIKIAALAIAIPSIVIAYLFFLHYVGGNGLIFGTVLAGVITATIEIFRTRIVLNHKEAQ